MAFQKLEKIRWTRRSLKNIHESAGGKGMANDVAANFTVIRNAFWMKE